MQGRFMVSSEFKEPRQAL